MFADVRVVRIAGQIRRAREVLSETHAQLLDVGFDDVSFHLTQIECELHEAHLNLMQPFRQLPPLPAERQALKERNELLHRQDSLLTR